MSHTMCGKSLGQVLNTAIAGMSVVNFREWCALSILMFSPGNPKNLLVQKVHDPLHSGLKDSYCIVNPYVALKII